MKMFTILLAIWTRRNGVIFCKHQFNHVDILEMEKLMISDFYK